MDDGGRFALWQALHHSKQPRYSSTLRERADVRIGDCSCLNSEERALIHATIWAFEPRGARA